MTTPPKPATTTQRVAALRARRSREGLVRLEVYAKVEQHKLIRDFVRMLNKSVDVTGNDG
jgi:hypothetical protein